MREAAHTELGRMQSVPREPPLHPSLLRADIAKLARVRGRPFGHREPSHLPPMGTTDRYRAAFPGGAISRVRVETHAARDGAVPFEATWSTRNISERLPAAARQQ
jgi:hypothetical protein